MTTPTDYKDLCTELVETWDATADFDYNDFGNATAGIVNRALLNQPEPPELTDEELLHIWQFNFSKTNRTRFLDIARAAIAVDRARWGRPTPQSEEAQP